MKQLIILGAGSAGTMMMNHLQGKMPQGWGITVVDKDPVHYYQPGFLFLPFGTYTEEAIKRPKTKFVPKGVRYVHQGIDRVDAAANQVFLEGGAVLQYDLLIIATGSRIAPEEIEGMMGRGWHKNVFDFYTFEGARNLRDFLATWEGGRLVVHLTEMPIKCPVAPLEFAFLADDFFRKKGIRNRVDITYVTPLSGAFTKPTASAKLGYLLEDKQIKVVPDFNIMQVDADRNTIVSYDGTEVPYDLLVTVPTNKGDDAMARSGLGDELNFVATDPKTLQHKEHTNIFVVGDATDVPASKAGSVAHFEAEILTENILRYIQGQPLQGDFDGHSNCFVETGNGKAMLLDFNYTQEPVEGTFPIPGVGPLSLLKESRMNHLGKHAFKWIYWNMLLKGIPIPLVKPQMSMKGKKVSVSS
jgi:sulfide:quinone oxidoreductase